MSRILTGIALTLVATLILTGCAAGAATAATAGYSLKSQTADNLTVEGEQRIIERAKKEILAEMARTSENSN